MKRRLAAAVLAAAAFATPALAGPSTCDFIKIALADAPNDFRDIADGTPKAGAPVKVKAYVAPTGWTLCVFTVEGGGTLACAIQSPQGRPAGEGKQGLAKGVQVIGGCLPAGWRHVPRAAGDGVNFADPKGVTRLTLTEVDQDAGAYEIMMLIGSPSVKFPK
jgi:hypothetical protein